MKNILKSKKIRVFVGLFILFVIFIGVGLLENLSKITTSTETSTKTSQNTQSVSSEREKLFQEIKWSNDCEELWKNVLSKTADINLYEIEKDKFIVEVPCGMTNQGPILSFYFYDKTLNSVPAKELALDQYYKNEKGVLTLYEDKTIRTQVANFDKEKSSLIITDRNTGIGFYCYYYYEYLFDKNSKDFILQKQSHAKDCDTQTAEGETQSSEDVIDFVRK